MAFSLGMVLAAAPEIIAGATEVIKLVKSMKSGESGPNEKTINDIEDLLEKQAMALHDIAESNRNLALAVRTNRIIAIVSLLIAIVALVLAIVR
jgi:hypothetical protein